MKNTNPIFSLKNFRSFGEDGADFELAPITVLTGCNSAGKSSLVKALLLLSKETGNPVYGGEKERISPSTTLPVSTQALALGKFDTVINANSLTNTIDLSYYIWSNYLQETVKVTRIYRAQDNDVLNDGELAMYSIEKTDGTIFYKHLGKNDKTFMGESYFDVIQSNYNIFRAAVEFNTLSFMQHNDNNIEDTLSETEIVELNEWREKLLELKKQMNDHDLEDFGNSISEWNKIIGERNERINASLYNLKRYDNQGSLMYEIAKKRIIELENREDDIEKNKELYVTLICNEVVKPFFIQDIMYADSSSAYIKRLYNIEENNKICSALRRMHQRELSDHDALNEGIICTNFTGTFLNKWIKNFQIGDGIKVEGTEHGVGAVVFLIKEGEKRLLADEGYGITQLVSLLLYIDNSIPSYPNDNCFTEYKPQYIYVEEPENHLHPKFQSLLADMFVEAYQKYNIHFIVETHSEYLIRKLQVMVADKENALTSKDVSLNYVEKEDGISTNRKIEILEDGRLSEPFGPGFFDEATDLSMRLLKMKMEAK